MRFILFVLTGILSTTASGTVTCPPIFSDNMVLQQNSRIAIWGMANPKEKVEVAFSGQVVQCTSSSTGEWQAVLQPLPATNHPGNLRISGTNTLLFRNVVVGEVWLCSGQSNMEKPIGEKQGQKPTENHLEEIARANHPRIRLFKMPKHGRSENPIHWQICSPESVETSEFSAVAYFFGVELLDRLDVPIGLIDSSFGGTMIEAWIPENSYRHSPNLHHLLDREYFAWVDEVQVTDLFHSMIQSLCPYTLRGFLWYQGESNLMDGDAAIYTAKSRALIDGWREAWSAPEAPFYFVQLAPFNYSDWTQFPKRQTPLSLPAFWEAQTDVLEVPNTGMVVTTDLAGDARDIHPIRKKEVGQRLAGLALEKTYGLDTGIVDFPALAGSTADNGGILLQFKHVGSGLKSRDGEPLSHFQIAGASGVFVPAKAKIIGPDQVIVSSASIADPVAVRFGWNETANPNLINSAGLPAVPFRTDSWPMITIFEQ